MRGIIVYNSKTGNTEHMARKIHEILSVRHEVLLSDGEYYDFNDMDFAIIGGWIDKATLDPKSRKILEEVPDIKTGVFATLGADPSSSHAREVRDEIEKLLSGRYELGIYLCHGVVDKESAKMIDFAPVDENLKEKIKDTAEKSREATSEELEDAGNYFLRSLEDDIVIK